MTTITQSQLESKTQTLVWRRKEGSFFGFGSDDIEREEVLPLFPCFVCLFSEHSLSDSRCPFKSVISFFFFFPSFSPVFHRYLLVLELSLPV